MLVLIDVIFSVIVYWLGNFQPTAQGFFTWIMWLFLDLVAAESLVVLVSSVFPNFVISLALTAFANGLWMSVNGFMVSPKLLNVFWRYVFHYIDYQVSQLATPEEDDSNISKPTGVGIFRNDGQRVRQARVHLWLRLPVHVPNTHGWSM
jgi:ABC-2 type transporter